jgi:hypothetical protein
MEDQHPEACLTWAVTSSKGAVYEQGAAARLVGYPRVSTRGADPSRRLPANQDREIRAWARRNGHRIVGMFPEGRSGTLDVEDRLALTAPLT